MRQRCRGAAVAASPGGQEIQVNGSTHELLPLRAFLPGKIQTLSDITKNDNYKIYVAAALRWALEERRAEDVLNASPDLAVGGASNTAPGPAWIYIHGPRHQHTQTGDQGPHTLRGVYSGRYSGR